MESLPLLCGLKEDIKYNVEFPTFYDLSTNFHVLYSIKIFVWTHFSI